MTAQDTDYQSFLDFSEWSDNGSVDQAALLNRIQSVQQISASRFDMAVKFVARAAAVDTGAIEKLYDTDRGFTYAVAAQTNAIDYIQNRRGDEFATHFSAHLKAYEFILDHATGFFPLAQTRIRELHEVLCEHQSTYRVRAGDKWEMRPLRKGAYKSDPNTVTKADGNKHYYCPPERVDYEVQGMIDQTETDGFKCSSGVVQAAYTHHVLTQIHPFSDGNGRVSRAVASIYLVRELGIPLLIHADQRDLYFDALESADSGKPGKFVDFVYDRVWETVDLIEDNVNASTDSARVDVAVAIESIRSKLDREAKGHDALVDGMARALSTQLITILNVEAENILNEHGKYIEIKAGKFSGPKKYDIEPVEGFRGAYGDSVKILVKVATANRGNSRSTDHVFDFLVPREGTDNTSIRIYRTFPEPQRLETYARLTECHGHMNVALERRLNSWANKIIKQVVVDFAD